MQRLRIPSSRRRGRPLRAESSPEGTRRRILDAALEVFGERGYHAAAVDDIVGRADASKGTFYFHFPNKQGIFMALADEAARRLAANVERAVADRPDALGKVDAALRAVLGTLTRHQALARLLLVDLVNLGGGFSAKLIEVHERLAGLVRDHLDAAVAEGSIPPLDTELAAYVWLGAINEIVMRWLHTGRPEPLESIVPELRALLLRSLGAPVPIEETSP
jgi:TetR/AcrR family transcriptional regulator, fatty acid metabolism regulator protein